jgi:hypothetical protein
MKKQNTCLNREQLFYFSQGMMEPREAERAREHVARCAVCQEAAQGYQQVNLALDSWKVDGSPWFDARTLPALVADGTRQGFFGLAWGRWLAPASLVTMAILALVMVYTWRQPARYEHHGSLTPQRPSAQAQVSSQVTGQPANGPGGAPAEATPAADELSLYKNLSVLENYDMLANFDLLSELAKTHGKASD